MVLAYATDLATGQSRDFCVAVLRPGDAPRRNHGPRRRPAPPSLSPRPCCAISDAMLIPICFSAAFGDEIALRQDPCSHRHGQPLGHRGHLRSRFSHAPSLRTHRPPKWPTRSKRVLPKLYRSVFPILAGHCEGGTKDRRNGLVFSDEIRKKSRSALRALGRNMGCRAGLKGDAVMLPVRMVTLAQDAVCLERGPWP